MEKLDYRKEYKDLYSPKIKPMIVAVPAMKFITVDGEGNPNTSKTYQEALEILYGLSFTIKMSKMGKRKIDGYFEYVVPPLEGLWTTKEVVSDYHLIDKDSFIWKSMIRQPEFVTAEIFSWAKEELKKKKPQLPIEKADLIEYEEGLCVQMMHTGSYDTEKESFIMLEDYIKEQGYEKTNTKYHHHEIYLTDPRKCKPEKNKTVLRYSVQKKEK